MDIQKIVINKNRGWRGLAEVRCLNGENKSEMDMIFSFSQPVWDDMQSGRMVLQDDEDYVIVHFDNTEALPKGQRSVLLKNFIGNISDFVKVPKTEIFKLGTLDYNAVIHFKMNRNNHTQSDWNCIRNKSYTRDIGARALCTEYLFYRAERRFDLKWKFGKTLKTLINIKYQT